MMPLLDALTDFVKEGATYIFNQGKEIHPTFFFVPTVTAPNNAVTSPDQIPLLFTENIKNKGVPIILMYLPFDKETAITLMQQAVQEWKAICAVFLSESLLVDTENQEDLEQIMQFAQTNNLKEHPQAYEAITLVTYSSTGQQFISAKIEQESGKRILKEWVTSPPGSFAGTLAELFTNSVETN